jgi:uncharacterized Zn finger protein (UPF0148 family)
MNTCNSFKGKPGQIFNCDDTGIPLQHSTGHVIVPTCHKRPFCISSVTKKRITVMACTRAAEYTLPPFVVFDRRADREGSPWHRLRTFRQRLDELMESCLGMVYRPSFEACSTS